jgi:hypothetical protein
VLVAQLADLDRVPLPQLRPQRLALAPAVVGHDRVGGAEDRLRRAVVLLEPDDVGIDELVLELEDIADVRSAEAVDRVVRDETAGDEVVGALHVQVEDRLVEDDLLDRLDDVVGAVLREHDHPRPDRCGRRERQ